MSGGAINLGRGLTPAVRALIIANVVCLALAAVYTFWIAPGSDFVFRYLALRPEGILSGYVWQVVTYMFLHSLADPFHILFNMFVLWSFGSLFEPMWGAKRFLTFYFACGLGGAAAVIATGLVLPWPYFHVPVVGASAAVLGFVIAFGLTFPDRYVFLFFMVPIQGRYVAVAVVVGDVLLNFLGTPVASHAHLGGMLTAFLLLTGFWRPKRMRRLWSDLDKKRRHKQMRKRFLDAIRERDD